MASLAVQFRPTEFRDVVGQKSIIQILERQIATRDISNCYLFCGPSGTGKTTLARIFANKINNGFGNPIEIDGASNNGVDNVRDIIANAKERSLDSEYKVYIIDECFTGDTLVNTSNGAKKIKDIVPGDKVMTLNGFNSVTYVHQKKVENSMLNYMRLSDGRTIITTADHLFLTTNGWIESKNLVKGDVLLDAKNMPKLWEDVQYKTQGTKVLQQQVPDGVSKQTQIKGFDRENLSYLWETLLCGNKKQQKEDLFKGMQSKVNIAVREDNNELRVWDGAKEIIIYKDDKSKSNEEFTKYREDALNQRVEWNSSSMDWEKRGKWLVYRTSTYALEGIRKFLDTRVFNQDKLLSEQSKQVCFIIQSRPWLSREENSSRGGWQFTQMEKEYCSRYEKDHLSKSVRVESVEIFQPGDNGEPRYGCTKDTILYDLTVEESPTYFANGVLVHNCHMITTAGWNAFLKCIEEPPKYTIFIFCTTDPQKVPSTIQNRVMRFNLSKLASDGIFTRLKYICENMNFTNYVESCDYISKICNGGVRDAIAMLEKCSKYSTNLCIDNVLQSLGNCSYNDFFTLTNAIIDKQYDKVIEVIENYYKSGNDLKVFMDQYVDFCLDLTKYCIFKDIGVTKLPLSSEADLKYVTGIESEDTTPFFRKLMSKILDIKNAIRYDSNAKSTIIVSLVNIGEN